MFKKAEIEPLAKKPSISHTKNRG